MIRRPPRSTRTDTLFPYTTLFRSHSRTTPRRGPCSDFSLNPAFPIDYIDVFSTTTRSEEHTSELQSLMRISYAVFCLKKKIIKDHIIIICQSHFATLRTNTTVLVNSDKH